MPEGFEGLKTALITSPVFALSRDKEKLHLETNMSDVATRVILSQLQEGRWYLPTTGLYIKVFFGS
jgi:hypothetical protein